jgi:hypothetical protein
MTRLVDRAEFDELVAAGRLTTVDGTDLARMADGTDVAPSFQRFLDSVEIPEDAIRLGSGTTGGWTTALHRPLPNQTYVVDGRFVYRTDAQGRVIAGTWTRCQAGPATPTSRAWPAVATGSRMTKAGTSSAAGSAGPVRASTCWR